VLGRCPNRPLICANRCTGDVAVAPANTSDLAAARGAGPNGELSRRAVGQLFGTRCAVALDEIARSGTSPAPCVGLIAEARTICLIGEIVRASGIKATIVLGTRDALHHPRGIQSRSESPEW
jgi:hypothetical protein